MALQSFSKSKSSSFTYTGREFEPELNMYYYRARYYDPSTGRFLQQDPDPGKLAVPLSHIIKYAYVGNNPINRTDPSGMSWLSDFFGGSGGFLVDAITAVAAIAVIAATGVGFGAAALAVAGVAGGALAASMVMGAFQGGNYWDNVANNFHTIFRIGATFLMVSAVLAHTLGGGVVSAGQTGGINGWVQSRNAFWLPEGYVGDLTMGPAALFNGTSSLAGHSLGHTLQFIGLGFAGNANSAWGAYLGLGALGLTPAGGFWEAGADFLGGLF